MVASLSAGAAEEKSDSETVVVLASGVGTTAENAVKNALANAVEKAVGLVVDAETVVKNDQIIREQIITYSDAYVSGYDEISRGKSPDGLTTIRIKATVQRKKLAEKLKAANVARIEVKGADLFAEAVTRLKQETDAAMIVRRAFENFPGDILKAEPVGKPRIIAKTATEATVGITVEYRMDTARYTKWLTSVRPFLIKAATKSFQVRWDPNQMRLPVMADPSYRPADDPAIPWEKRPDKSGRCWVPREYWRKSYLLVGFIPPWWPDVHLDSGIVLLESQDTTAGILLLFDETAYREAAHRAVALPAVSVSLKSAEGDDIATEDRAAIFGHMGSRWFAWPFWLSVGGQTFTPVARDAYPGTYGRDNDEIVPTDARPKKEAVSGLLRQGQKLIIWPYCSGNERLVPAFRYEHVFELPLDKLAKVKQVEVKMSTRNDAVDERGAERRSP